MKKKNLILVLLIGCLVCSYLCSCNFLNNQPHDRESTPPNSNGIPSKDVTSPPPSDRKTFHFDNYDELKQWLSQDENNERDDDAWGEEYLNYVQDLSENSALLSFPLYDNELMKLREIKGFQGISFMTSELYGLPWVWYFGMIDGNLVVVKQACLSNEYSDRLKTQDVVQFKKWFAPNSPNSSNIESYPNYEKITESDITISGNKVKAIIYEIKNDKRIKVEFIINGSLFLITAEKDSLDKEFWSKFSIVQWNES